MTVIDDLGENVSILIFFVVTILIFIVQRIIQSGIKKTAEKENIPPDVVNGL